MKIQNAVYLTADRKKAVPAGHPDAAFLLCGRGGVVPDKVAKQYDLTESGAPGQKTAAEEKPHVPHMVTENARDGINTHPDSPAGHTPKTATIPAKVPEGSKSAASKPATEGKAKPAAAPEKLKGKPGRKPGKAKK